jgi:PPP family 3-phenylpropionic acid transporter
VFILLAQALHAITYGTFHMASILYIDRLTPEKSKTLGQAVNNAVQYGLGLMIGFFLNGFLYERAGSSVLFVISGCIALAGGLIFGGYVWLRQSD